MVKTTMMIESIRPLRTEKIPNFRDSIELHSFKCSSGFGIPKHLCLLNYMDYFDHILAKNVEYLLHQHEYRFFPSISILSGLYVCLLRIKLSNKIKENSRVKQEVK